MDVYLWGSNSKVKSISNMNNSYPVTNVLPGVYIKNIPSHAIKQYTWPTISEIAHKIRLEELKAEIHILSDDSDRLIDMCHNNKSYLEYVSMALQSGADISKCDSINQIMIHVWANQLGIK